MTIYKEDIPEQNTRHIRFFMAAIVDGEPDFAECSEAEFLSLEGDIEYERFSLFKHGVAYVSLTRRNDLI